MIQDTPYYDRVAMCLSKMEDGDTFSIRDKVKPENQKLFIDCFRYYAAVFKDGAYWWEWDDITGMIYKHAHAWVKKIRK